MLSQVLPTMLVDCCVDAIAQTDVCVQPRGKFACVSSSYHRSLPRSVWRDAPGHNAGRGARLKRASAC